ncbi:outer membrane beta-barrel protein [Marilutibacter spongiae]|uniref:Porin family protein n=1 Tax=Marilutibacter spongiae TaxID=2025720 RepID=A0A7W3TP35_9GAMM|nr:acyloxyacyl hydrolase [Lysobacter spongiae]MBB1061629.1 porin family protein [Lysobacter spongiae]
MKKTLILAGASLAIALFSSAALAGQGFLRAEVGNSEIELDYAGLRDDDSDTSAVFGGGYWFNPNFAVEGHVGSLYNADLGNDQEADLITVGVGIAGRTHFGQANTGFFIDGRVGVARLTAQVREDTFDVIDDESSTKPYYGVSVGYDFNPNWGISLNYDRRQGEFDGVDVDVDTVSLGGEWRF